jgi:nucleolar protein 6
MSQDDAPSRKEKKAQRDADRRKKGKKRKHDEVEDDAKDDEKSEFDKDFLPLDSRNAETVDTNVKMKAKKDKFQKRKSEELALPTPIKPENEDSKAAQPKPKKRQKNKVDTAAGETSAKNGDTSEKTHRFILFVGNLPYSATDVALRAHFKKLEPYTLRHRTDPKTKKSKGFAFLEFENYDRMKTCLKLYHHSMFDPNGTQPVADEVGDGEEDSASKLKNVKDGKNARRINVELTAGGGGKAEGRKEKIRAKNERLGEQRQRRAEAERKEREKKARKEGETNDHKNLKSKKNDKKAEEAKAPQEEMGAMHPSRLARIAA